MLEGVVPFPPEFAQRYSAKGYWQDKSLAQEFAFVFERFAKRTALIDGERVYSYEEVDRLSDNLALNLLELGLRPLDRVVPTLPNIAEFVLLYFALQKIGAIPIAALVTHRFAEINQFVELSGASTCVYPERQGDFEFEPMIRRVQAENPSLKFCVSLGLLKDLIERPAKLPRSRLAEIRIDPTDQRSGGRQVRPLERAHHPERRPAHAARGAAAHASIDPQLVRAGELRHVRRHAVLRAPRRSAGSEARDVRPADLRRRRSAAPRRRRPAGARWRSRRADLPRALYVARLLRRARVQQETVHARRLLSLGRPDAQAPVGQLRGGRAEEGPDQPRRREDQRRGNREPHPVAS